MTPRLVLPLIALLVGASMAPGVASAEQDPPPLSAAQASPAQQEAVRPPRVQGGLGIMIGVPVGDFRENVEIAGGLSGHVDVGLGRSPISVGAEATYLWYGSESRDIPLVGRPDLRVRVNTSNDIFLLHGRVRAQRREARVRPYVDGLVGFVDLVTTTTVEGDVSCSGYPSGSCSGSGGDSVTDLRDFAFSAGAGAGVMVAFTSSPRSARLDVSVRYLYGGEAQYLTEGAIGWGNPAANLPPRRSRTDMVLVYVGVAFGR